MPPTRGSSWLRDWTHPMAPALQAASLPLSHQGSPPIHDILFQKSDKMWTFHYCFWFKNVELFLLCWANVILKNVWYSITHFCYCVDNIINKMNGLYNISNFFLKTQFSSVAQSCLTLCDPMNRWMCSMTRESTSKPLSSALLSEFLSMCSKNSALFLGHRPCVRPHCSACAHLPALPL